MLDHALATPSRRRPSMGCITELDDSTFTGYCHGCSTPITGTSVSEVSTHDCDAWLSYRQDQYAARALKVPVTITIHIARTTGYDKPVTLHGPLEQTVHQAFKTPVLGDALAELHMDPDRMTRRIVDRFDTTDEKQTWTKRPGDGVAAIWWIELDTTVPPEAGHLWDLAIGHGASAGELDRLVRIHGCHGTGALLKTRADQNRGRPQLAGRLDRIATLLLTQ